MPSKTLKSSRKSAVNRYSYRGGIEPIDFITSNNMGFVEGCIIKYIYRRAEGDLGKIITYARILIDKEDK